MWNVLLKAIVGFGAFPIALEQKKWTFKKTCIQSVLKTL